MPVFFDSVEFNLLTIPIIVFASIVGSLLFGSIASIISTRIKSSEGFNVIINTVFLFFAFVSTAFYPASGAPEPLATAFYINPLTYLVDVIRAGIFGTFSEFIIMEMIILIILSSALFVVAIKLLTKLKKEFINFVSIEIYPSNSNLQYRMISQIKDKGIAKFAWNQLLLTLQFWLDDETQSFVKTELFIENNVNASFDLKEIKLVPDVISFNKFLVEIGNTNITQCKG